jgi:D-alanyl-D-alanine carboxypeptidase (penicillin-binding protein 5/6)
MWMKLVPVAALVATLSLTGGSAHAAPTEPVGGEALGSRGLVSPQGVSKPPKSKATSYVIADVGTGQVLAAKDAHGRYLPASTLKTLTALALIPKLDKNRKIPATRRAPRSACRPRRRTRSTTCSRR